MKYFFGKISRLLRAQVTTKLQHRCGGTVRRGILSRTAYTLAL